MAQKWKAIKDALAEESSPGTKFLKVGTMDVALTIHTIDRRSVER